MTDFDMVLTNLKGEPAKNGKGEPLTLREVCLSALLMPDPGVIVPVQEKLIRYNLGIQIHCAKGEVRLLPEDIELLKRTITETMTRMVAGKACDALEGKPC